MIAISPWLLNTRTALNTPDVNAFDEWKAAGFHFAFYVLEDSCWLAITFANGQRVAFRLAYAPGRQIEVGHINEKDGALHISADTAIGHYQIIVSFPSKTSPVLRCTTTLKPAKNLLLPYWPRDIVPLQDDGEVYLSQTGTRSGQLYFRLADAGGILYLQNLTALADYNQQTETSAGNTVGGIWPEIGFALPPTLNEKPLEAGKNYVLSDALIALTDVIPKNEAAMVQQYLDLLAAAYLELPKPETQYKEWPEILDKGLKDLIQSPGCWLQLDGHHYFNAYVCDYETPPEIMVQLAILLPLLDYVEWSGAELEVMRKIKEGLPSFYDEKLKTVLRWHAKAAEKLKGEEEQKSPMVMDSWYLHHPLLNLSRLALKGDAEAKKLFLNSLEFSIRVAHHFNYQWPVFYKIDTLEVVKAETKPGAGGEKDVPGLYAHVMLQAWELTGNKRYLREAEKSARTLKGLGFELFYQANNTAFASGAMLRLYKATGKPLYLELSYLCLANIFKNARLWDCNYGYGKYFPTFFTIFPLNDAPYTAVYEEQEVFCALHDYLYHAEGIEILPSLRLLIAEYIHYLVDRAVYYYPPMLPDEMLAAQPKIGEVDRKLWIALEDLQDGWQQSGQVGQEVYGAGNAFGILPRHYMQTPGGHFMIFTDYPTEGFKIKAERPAKFRLAGDGRINCRLLIVKTGRAKLPELSVHINDTCVKGARVANGNLEFLIPGNAAITINWV